MKAGDGSTMKAGRNGSRGFQKAYSRSGVKVQRRGFRERGFQRWGFPKRGSVRLRRWPSAAVALLITCLYAFPLPATAAAGVQPAAVQSAATVLPAAGAQSAVGVQPAAGAQSTTGVQPAAAPGAPAAPTLTSGANSLTAAWSAPSNTGGSAITDYRVRYRQQGTSGWTTFYDGHSDQSPGTKSIGPSRGLDMGTVSGVGVTVTREALGNGYVYKVGGAVRRLKIWLTGTQNNTNVGLHTVAARYASGKPGTGNLSTHGTQLWSESVHYSAFKHIDSSGVTSALSADSYFWVYATHDTSLDNLRLRLDVETVSTGTSAVIGGLTKGSHYEVQVQAVSSQGDGAWSVTASAPVGELPGAPGAPVLVSGDRSLAVRWSAPSSTGGFDPNDYDVRYCPGSATHCDPANTSRWTQWRASTTSTATGTTITGLVNGTAYQVQVRAGNDIGDGPWSPRTQETAGAPDATSAPTLVTGNRQVAVSWTAPADDNGSAVTDYDVRYCAGSATHCDPANTGRWTQWRASTTSTVTGTTITGLVNGTAYRVQVRAQNARAEGAWSAAVSATPRDAPSAPGVPILVSADRGLHASWAAPPDNASTVVDYDLRYCAGNTGQCPTGNAGKWTQWRPDATSGATNSARSTTVTGLINGTLYQVQVRAGSASHEGPWSAAAGGVAGRAGTPSAPTLASADAGLTASWTAAAANGSPITDYDIRYSTDNGTTWTLTADNADSTATGATLTGLTNGAAHRVQVRAENAHGQSDWSSPSSVVVGAPAPPAAPTPTAGDRSVTVTWAAPAANGSPITDYDIRYSTDNGTTWTQRQEPADSTALTTTVTGLTAGDAYLLQVRAENARGAGYWSPSSARVALTAAPAAPGAPTLVVGSTQLSVQWQAPSDNGSVITDYDVQYRACTDSDKTCPAADDTWGAWTDASHTGTATSATLTSLTNSTAHQVRVRAANAVGSGTWSASAGAVPGSDAPPTAPLQPTVNPGDGQITVTWTAPADNGAAITDYDIRYSSNGGTTWSRYFDGGSLNNKHRWAQETHDGPNGTPVNCGSPAGGSSVEYESNGLYKITAAVDILHFRCAASPRISFGAATVGSLRWATSAPSGNLFTAGTELARTSKPAGTYHALTVDGWFGPFDAGDYFWFATDRGQTFGTRYRTVRVDLASTATSAAVKGLSNGTAYLVQVRAGNSRGDGPWSPSSLPAVAGAPAAVAAPTLTSGDERLAVDWTAPAANGSAITDYDVRYSANNGVTWTEWNASDTSTASRAAITNLINDTTYQVQVRAGNSRGDGPWSASATATAGAPEAPAAPMLVSGDSSLSVSWSAPADNGAAITDYDVRHSSDNGATWTEWKASDTSTALSATVTGLVNGTAYLVQVRAGNARGDGPWSQSPLALKAGLPDAPAPPGIVTGSTQLALSWSAPAANGSAITDYDVQYASAPSRIAIPRSPPGGTPTGGRSGTRRTRARHAARRSPVSPPARGTGCRCGRAAPAATGRGRL